VTSALGGVRICDFSGQLAGAGATRFLAAMGAQVIRVEDPVTHGYWDVLRGVSPFVDDRRGPDFGGPFNNHNVEKLGVTLNLRTAEGKELLRELVAVSDVVTENFAPGVMERLGFPYEVLRSITEDIVYVSNSGYGHSGPYRDFKTWGPLVQAGCGLAFATGIADEHPAGIGYSYMDHHGANVMAIAIMAGLLHRNRTGDGQWIDISCTDAGAFLNGPALLDYTVNGRPLRRPGSPDSNRSRSPVMAPHGIYPCDGADNWVAIACRDDGDWQALAGVVAAPWCEEARWASCSARVGAEDELDGRLAEWTRSFDRFWLAATLRDAGVPAAAVQRPSERIEHDAETADWGLWPSVTHSKMGKVRVDGIPVHFSKTDWVIERGAPCLGEHNDVVFGDLLGHTDEDISAWRTAGVL
jgi:benzylsuccinate CoA-transferase BbsF subunit